MTRRPLTGENRPYAGEGWDGAAHGATRGGARVEAHTDPSTRVETIDGLRAIAAGVVLLFHVASASGRLQNGSLVWQIVAQGGIGVPIFFVLSGLLLYRPWVRPLLAAAPSPSPSVRIYFWRRALRVLPAYWIVAAVALVAFSGAHIASVTTWAEWLTLTQIYDPSPWWPWLGVPGLTPIWSLATELSFYLALPVLAAALSVYARRGPSDPGQRARRLLIGTCALILSSLAWTVAVYLLADADTRLHVEQWLPRWLCCFGAGMALAVFSEWLRVAPGRPAARVLRTIAATPGFGWAVALTALVVVATPVGTAAVFTTTTGGQYLSRALLYLLIAVAVIAPVALGHRSGLLGSRVMAFLGRISFGIFLWHSVVIEAWSRISGRPYLQQEFWVLLAVTVPVTLLLASLTYAAVERPALALSGGRRRAGKSMESMESMESVQSMESGDIGEQKEAESAHETGAEDWEDSRERTGRAYDLVPPPPPAPRAPSGHFTSGSTPVRLTDQAGSGGAR